ncbi:hypothetical protein C8Q77DRAFT_1196281 [Trametes polyzona]|nr:hypothetical protein C8Q77DRAFT_1196281 [Trametes polyzona]
MSTYSESQYTVDSFEDGPSALAGSAFSQLSIADEAAQTYEETEPVTPQPDDEFWFEDGNLILIAGDVEFKVYKGPLVANSPVFRDMFSLPQPLYTDEAESGSRSQCTSDAYALVHVVADHPQDLKQLLRALVPGSTPWVAPVDPPFDAISACIRLGHKYKVECVVQQSLNYLKKYFVETYQRWSGNAPLRPPFFQDVHSIGVVNLARMMDADILLPTALMNCCMLDDGDFVNGFIREDGVAETLSPEDIGRCFIGRANLMRANTLAILNILDQTLAEGCTRPDVCATVLRRLVDELRAHEDVVCSLYWYQYWVDYIDCGDNDRQLCPACYQMLFERGTQQHRDIWNRLPEMMGVSVEGWTPEPPLPAETPLPETEDEED